MGLRKSPNVFTEQGVAMLSSGINSETAIEVQHIKLTTFRRVLHDFATTLNDLLSIKWLFKVI